MAATLSTPLIAAQAHTALVTSSPAAGSQVSAPVSTVRLTFTAPIDTTSAAVTLAIDGAAPRPLTAAVERQDLIATIPAEVIADGARATGPQPWTIAYRAVYEDGHPISDQLTFTVTATRTRGVDRRGINPRPCTPGRPPPHQARVQPVSVQPVSASPTKRASTRTPRSALNVYWAQGWPSV